MDDVGLDAVVDALEADGLRSRVAVMESVSAANMPLPDALGVLRGDGAPDPAVRRAVLMRRDLPVGSLLEASVDADPSIRAFALGRADAPLEAVVRACADPSWLVRVEVARRGDCPVDVLEDLALDGDPVVRRAALAHVQMSPRLLVRVLTQGQSRLDAEIAAAHPALDVQGEKRALLSATRYGAVALLSRDDLPVALVRRYAEPDQGPATRLKAVGHVKCPSVVLGLSATADPEPDIRAAAAAREECPPDALFLAASDAVLEVRRACAGNDSCPEAAVSVLLADHFESVRVRAVKRAAALPEGLAQAVRSDPDLAVRRAAIANARCPASVLTDGCSDAELVFDAAANAACPPEGVFGALVTIRDLPRDPLPRSSDDKPGQKRRQQVRALVGVCRRRLGGRRWSWLSERPLQDLHPEDLQSLLTRHLGEAVSDPREIVRAAVAGHPETGDAVLAALAGDPSLLVRQVVTERILSAAGADRD